jgi:DMSO/TMAO reductase YedYZ molybdopterin-dependent catalytic subunit
MTLPPGQHAIDGFPRFGIHLHHPPPPVPSDPSIGIRGAVRRPFSVPLAELAALPRRELTADFHCIAGWTAKDLRWEGVAFETVYERIVEPALEPGPAITHVSFGGLDGYRSILTIEDALSPEVLIAENLNGRPLDADHGAPARLVSPSQYGFVSTKHLSTIELYTTAPTDNYGRTNAFTGVGLYGPLFQRHPRARVWNEERHRYLPGWSLRPVYRLLIPPVAFLSARGADRDDG